MDPAFVAMFVPAVIGGTAGFIGGTVAALMRESSWRQVTAAVMGGTGTGLFFAPAVVNWFSLPVSLAGVVGFVGGLCVFALVAGLQKLADRFAQRPESMLPGGLRQKLGPPEDDEGTMRMPDDEHPTPPDAHRTAGPKPKPKPKPKPGGPPAEPPQGPQP